MTKLQRMPTENPLTELCNTVKRLVLEKDYAQSQTLIVEAMQQYPHAPQPHNLLGIVLEKTGNHTLAMKHFRAAWALDPTYRPANHNLETYGTFISRGGCAFDEADIPLAQAQATTLYEKYKYGCIAKQTEQ